MVYGAAFNLLAVAYLAIGAFYEGSKSANDATHIDLTFRVWAHLCIMAVLGRDLLPILFGGALPRETAALLFAASLMSLFSAQWFQSAGAVYAAGGFAAAGAALIIPENLPFHSYAY